MSGVKIKKYCERCDEFQLFTSDKSETTKYLCAECFNVLGFPTSEKDSVCYYCGDRWSNNHARMCQFCMMEITPESGSVH